MDVEEGEKIKTKSIDNPFYRIIAENSLTLRKRELPSTGNLQNAKQSGPKKETPPDTS
jgi:hypothetical protein